MPSVLFVCTANLYRSPLAEAFFKKKLKEAGEENWIVGSAGTWADEGLPPIPRTLEDAEFFDLYLQEHRTRRVSAEILAPADLVLVMEIGQKEALYVEFPQHSRRIFLLSEAVDGKTYTIPDPFLQQQASEREIIEELDRMIKRGFDRICELAKNLSLEKPR